MTTDTTQLLMQMALVAGQIAQSTLPAPSQSTGQTGGKSDFQSMLEDKRAQAGQSGQAGRPEQPDRPQDQTDETQPVQDEERPALQPQADPAAQLAAVDRAL